MRASAKVGIAALGLLGTVGEGAIAQAAPRFWSVPALTAVSALSGGELLIRFDGLPDPGQCGKNYGWVVIQAGNSAMQALAISIYLSAKPARVDTSDPAQCYHIPSIPDAGYEIVTGLYSPGG